MTRMLASVADVDEAKCLLALGVDILDIKEPRQGALGAVDTGVVRAIVELAAGRVPTSATIGDVPLDVAAIAGGITAMRATGVDIIKVGIFAGTVPEVILNDLRHHAQTGLRIVLVYFADFQPLVIDFRALAAAGIHGVMLDTANKNGGSLRTIMNEKILADFIGAARNSGLLTGLAGSLRQEDIRPLLTLGPDYLGFRGALCNGQRRDRTIDCNAVRAIRSSIPIHRHSKRKECDSLDDGEDKFLPPLRGKVRMGVGA